MVTWQAYVDESMRQRRDRSGCYVLAAALVDETDADRMRAAAQMLVDRRYRRAHWRAMDRRDRFEAVSRVAEMESLHVVVVGTRLDLHRQERGRRICLRRLLWELEATGVKHVWLEARTASLNAKDRAAVNAWRSQQVIGGGLRVDFAQPFGPTGEPLLWLPDIVAGAVSAAFGDGDDTYVAVLKSLMTKIQVDLD